MKRENIIYTSIIIFCLLTTAVHAQTQKFGKVSKQELAMTAYEKDTSAAAVVLFDVGRTYFTYNTNKGGFQMTFERHRRIKIFNKDGYGYADMRISLYDPGADEERLNGLKGYTYSNANGKLEKYKLEKSDIIDDRHSDDWKVTTFTMPNVTEGCIIEYEYKITSDFYTFLKEWEFQGTIPVIYSEYQVDIPQYLKYQKVNQGFLILSLKDKSSKSGSVNFMSSTRPSGGFSNQSNGRINSQTVNYTINSETWVLEHAPALKEEEYITTLDDYITKINYQLAGVDYPGEPYRDVLGSWDKINKLLLEHENFGRQLGKGKFLDDVVAKIKGVTNEPSEQVVLAYEYIKESMNWDKDYDLFTTNSLKKIHENKKGNSADINLLLTSLIQELGISAHPVALSTRDHGKINIAMPMIKPFNYVICAANIDGKYLLLDATSKDLKPGMLPVRCLNWKGRIISEVNSSWIDINPTSAADLTVNSFLKLDDTGLLKGNVVFANNGYSAAFTRRSINNKGVDKYIEGKKDDFGQDFLITEHEVKNLDDYTKKLDVKLTVESTEGALGNIVYMNPLIVNMFDENPFKQENRLYPVDFGIPIKEKMMTTIVLPEGFIVDEMPKPATVTLPDNAGLFKFQVVNQNNMIQVLCSFSLNKTLFLPDEYAYLKEFFNYVINKQEEQIVIKRKS